MLGSRASSAESADATAVASWTGDRDEGRTIRSVIHRNSSPWMSSSAASSAMNPSAMRQYRLRYQTNSDIGEFVARAPDRQDEPRLIGIGLDLPADALDQGVHAARSYVGVVPPDPLDEGLAREHDPAVAREQ